MSSTKAAVYPCLFPAFVPAWLEKSSSGNYMVLARATDFSPVSARKDGSFGQISIGMVSQC